MPTGYQSTDNSFNADLSKYGLSAIFSWMSAPQGDFSRLMSEDPTGAKYADFMNQSNKISTNNDSQLAQQAQLDALKNSQAAKNVNQKKPAAGDIGAPSSIDNPTIQNVSGAAIKTLLGQ